MQTFLYDPHAKAYQTEDGSKRYRVLDELGRGTYGKVYSTDGNRILKVMQVTREKNFLQELEIQRNLSQKEPGVCPILYDYGKRLASNEYILVMEKYDGDVNTLMHRDKTILLDFLKQIATILQRLEKYNFNHRDLKRDNTMYKGNPKKYALIDFGFSCATFDGVRYAGTSYFPSTAKCFRRSRDLAQLIYETERYTQGLSANDRTFLRLLLTFQINGKKCEMFKGCPPHKITKWLDTYDFLENDAVENPHTTPEGLLHAISVYQTRGIEACKNGFVVDPVTDTCVVRPPVAAVVPRDKPKTPEPAPGLKPCPPGKVRHPVTRRCRKQLRVKTVRLPPPPPAVPAPIPAAVVPPVRACPPDKIVNPATNRCVKRDGAIGKRLVGN